MSKIEDNASRVAKNSLFLAIRMVFIIIISLFTTRYLLKNLGVEDYGVYNVTLGIVAMCTFLSPALSNASQRFHNYELGKNGVAGAKSVFNTGLQIQLMMIVVIIVLAETIGLWYVNYKLVIPLGRESAVFWVYQISIAAFSVSMLQIPFVSSILAHEHMNFYAIVNVIDAILKLAIAIGIAYSSYDKLIIYGLLLLCINLFNISIYGIYSYKNYKEIRIEKKIDVVLFEKMMSFSGWNLFETIARLGKDQGCNLLLNSYFGPILNAARGVANQVSYAFASLVDSTVMASRPQLVQSYASGNVNKTIEMFYTLSKFTGLLIIGISLPVFLEANYILKLWLGDNVPEYSVIFIRVSIIILLIDKLASPITAVIHATGQIKGYHLCSGIMNILVIPISWVMLNYGTGPLSVYISTFLIGVFAEVLFLYFTKRVITISYKYYFMEIIVKCSVVLILSLIIPLSIVTLIGESFIRMLVVIVSSVIVSSLLIYYIGMNKKEKSILLTIVKK